ncbi:MAG: outer membrane beta-barrel protein [Limnohabitans sp.]
MKTRIRFLSGMAIIGTAAAAQAQVYMEGSVTRLTTQEGVQGIRYEAKPLTFSALVGYNVHPNWGLEAYLAMGAGHARVTENGTNYGEEVSAKSAFGVFVKPKIVVGNDLELFARLGYLDQRFSTNFKNKHIMTANMSGAVAYGVGVNYHLDHRFYVTGSFMNFYKQEGFKVNGLSMGMGYKF